MHFLVETKYMYLLLLNEISKLVISIDQVRIKISKHLMPTSGCYIIN